ncbi:MAG: ABC transporter ATP-binding protein [Planctomycetota bacterium]|nr:ABC transporter ATP-binding protein [Planctomycetota bacterium]
MTDQSALRIENLKFRYHKRRKSEPWVIDIPALQMHRGDQMLLTGGSGRGKSTLLHLICGLMDPLQGETYVDGTPIHSLHGAQRDLFRGKRIGMIFQSFNLLHGFSALDNVMAALMFSTIPKGEHRKRANYMLRHLGIEHPRRHPDKMSIGQQQRVAVARAMVCDPVLVLADEPTASLDPENARIAIKLIQDICQEKNAALLCVSHDPALPERFENRVSLDELAKGVLPVFQDDQASPPEQITDSIPLATGPAKEAIITPPPEEHDIATDGPIEDDAPIELGLDGDVLDEEAKADVNLEVKENTE